MFEDTVAKWLPGIGAYGKTPSACILPQRRTVCSIAPDYPYERGFNLL